MNVNLYNKIYNLCFNSNKELNLNHLQRTKVIEKLKELIMFTETYRQILPTNEDEYHFMIKAFSSKEVKEKLTKNYTLAKRLEMEIDELDSLNGKMLVSIMNSLKNNSNLIEFLLSEVEIEEYRLLESLRNEKINITVKSSLFFIYLYMQNIRFLIEIVEPYFYENKQDKFYNILHFQVNQLIIDTQRIIDTVINWEGGANYGAKYRSYKTI